MVMECFMSEYTYTTHEMASFHIEGKNWFAFYLAIEAKLKEKNDND